MRVIGQKDEKRSEGDDSGQASFVFSDSFG
jgi:hypothetical protein